MAQYEKLFKQAISLNCPIQFNYSSNKSPFFPDAESPEHPRIVQPVVLGVKQWPSGKKGIYFRGYLLNKYSYSRNKNFGTEITNNARKPRYWRLYNIAKMKNVTLLPSFPKNQRFYPNKHREYNPQDKFFNQIIYYMDKAYGYSYFYNGKEESETKVTQYVRTLIREKNLKLIKPIQFYAISENEEVGFIDTNFVWINTVWASQNNQNRIIQGLKSFV